MEFDTEGPVIPFGEYPLVYADGVGDVQIVETNICITLFRWRRVGAVFQRCYAAEIIRPRNTLPKEMSLWRHALGEEENRIPYLIRGH